MSLVFKVAKLQEAAQAAVKRYDDARAECAKSLEGGRVRRPGVVVPKGGGTVNARMTITVSILAIPVALLVGCTSAADDGKSTSIVKGQTTTLKVTCF